MDSVLSTKFVFRVSVLVSVFDFLHIPYRQ